MGSADVPGDVWFYVPNEGAAILFAVLFGLFGCTITYYVFQGGIRRFFWAVLVGILMEVGGFACRAVARNNLDAVALFAVQQSLVVLAPLFVAAGNYMIISRIIAAPNQGESSKRRIFFIPARKITAIFVACDVVTILIQVSGTSISAGDDWKGPTARIGSNILLAGLGVQTATVACFIAIVLKFGGVRLLSVGVRGAEHYFKALESVFISSIFIELRCIFRLIEHATGYDGYLFTHEWNFYVFEALPMIIATGIYTVWYPPHYVQGCTSYKEGQKELRHGGSSRDKSLEDGVTE